MMSEKLHLLDNVSQTILLAGGAVWLFFETNLQDFTALALFVAAAGKAYVSVREAIAKRNSK